MSENQQQSPSTFFALTENKTVVHIVIEGIVIFGMFYYFSSKNRKLVDHIEELTQRIEEYEERMNNFENILNAQNLTFNQFAKKTVENFSNSNMRIETILKSHLQKNQPKSNLHSKQRVTEVKQADVPQNFQEELPVKTEERSQQFYPPSLENIHNSVKSSHLQTDGLMNKQRLAKIEEIDENSSDISADSDVDIDIQDELNEMNQK
jgi:hypothetical protein